MAYRTDKQAEYILSLWADICSEAVPEGLVPDGRKDASALISGMLESKRVNAHDPGSSKAPPTNEDPEPGFYKVGEDVYRVVTNKAGTRRYAKALCNTGWEYVGRSPFSDLGPDTVLTVEEAMQHGLATGHCMICSARLDNIESAQYGIGPTCFKNMTGMTYAAGRKAGLLAAVVTPDEPVTDAERIRTRTGNQWGEIEVTTIECEGSNYGEDAMLFAEAEADIKAWADAEQKALL